MRQCDAEIAKNGTRRLISGRHIEHYDTNDNAAPVVSYLTIRMLVVTAKRPE
jgi:hypothetical protein